MRFLATLLLVANSALTFAGTFSLHDKGRHGCNLQLNNICGCQKRIVTVSEEYKCDKLPGWPVYLKGEV
ncbi:MAG: hypothetical protein L6R38_009745, partial [Xanthoria sp. 2 TBL-2021]